MVVSAAEAFSVSAERGASEVCPTFGAVDSPSLAFSITVALSSHASLVSFIAHASGTGGRQTDHQFRLGCISFKADPFQQANKQIQSLLKPLPIFSRKQSIVGIEQGQGAANGTAQSILGVLVGDHQGEPVSNHCVDHNVKINAGFEATLDVAAFG